MKRSRISVALIVAGIIVFIIWYGVFVRLPQIRRESLTLSVDVSIYKKADKRQTELVSRKWMNYAVSVVKHDSLTAAVAARFYAYVATAFSDGLDLTEDVGEANEITRQVINILTPEHKEPTDKFADSLGVSKRPLGEKGQGIVESLRRRKRDDGFSLTLNSKIPAGDHWFIRDNKKDPGEAAGEWLPWILTKEQQFVVPPPPKRYSVEHIVELAKVLYATRSRKQRDLSTIYFWHGTSGFVKGRSGGNKTLAGLWQDILFMEEGSSLGEKEYARSQKLLAQAIVDSFIAAWRVKYSYWTKRPSMRLPALDIAVGDPPFPGFVSEYATISYTAASVLSFLFPNKNSLWIANATDAKNSRVLAGVNFDFDNKVGASLGVRVGEIIVGKIAQNKEEKDLSTTISDRPSQIGSLLVDALTLGVANVLFPFHPLVGEFSSKLFGPRTDRMFRDVAKGAGVLEPGFAGGATWADYDGDGLLDLYVTSRTGGGNKLYKNTGKGIFTDVTIQAGVGFVGRSSSAVFADYDNDGDQDLYVVNTPGDNILRKNITGNILYRHNSDGTFSDVTVVAGVGDTGHGRGAAWGDYNNDGYLDLYLTNFGYVNDEGVWTQEENRLYRNNGDGTFMAAEQRSGVASVTIKWANPLFLSLSPGLPYTPVWFDYNNDGLLDLFVACDVGISPLFKNNGNGTFSDVTEVSGLDKFGTGMGVTIADYNNDGYLDIYVTNADENYLWHNNGDGTFSEVALETGVGDTATGWGVGFIDYDNDGDEDIFIANGATPEKVFAGPQSRKTNSTSVLYEQITPGQFINNAEKVGLEFVQISRAASFADFNNDGFTDIFVTSLDQLNRLYQNQGNGNHWLTIVLIGTKSNRDGIGARITVKVNTKRQFKQVMRGSSYQSGNSPWVTFGLGDAQVVDSVTVYWPSGVVQTITNVSSNQRIFVTEKEDK